jgi:hypothetical protein
MTIYAVAHLAEQKIVRQVILIFWYFDAKRGICKWDVGAIATNIAVEYA